MTKAESEITNPKLKERKKRGPWGALQIESMKALAEPDPENPTERKHKTDRDAAIATLGESLIGLPQDEADRLIANRTQGIITSRTRFTATVLEIEDPYSLKGPNTTNLALRIIKDIRAMYPEQNLSYQDILSLVDRPRIVRVSTPFNSSNRQFESSRSTIDVPVIDIYLAPSFDPPNSRDVPLDPETFMSHILKGKPGESFYSPSNGQDPQEK